MATYSDIQTRVLRALIDTPTSVQTEVPMLINEALSKLQGKHNFQVMKAQFDTVTTSGTRLIGPVPANWKHWRGRPYYTEELGTQKLITIVTDQQNVEQYRSLTDEGFPQFLLLDNPDEQGQANFVVYPTPDDNSDYADGQYRIRLPYWKYLAPLVGPSDTNWFLQHNPAIEYIIKQATAEGYYLNQDEDRGAVWEGRAAQNFKDVVLIDKYSQLSGFDTWVPHDGANAPRVNK